MRRRFLHHDDRENKNETAGMTKIRTWLGCARAQCGGVSKNAHVREECSVGVSRIIALFMRTGLDEQCISF